MADRDEYWTGRQVAIGGLVHVEELARLAIRDIRRIDSPTTKPGRHHHTVPMSLDERITAIEGVMSEVRILLKDGYHSPARRMFLTTGTGTRRGPSMGVLTHDGREGIEIVFRDPDCSFARVHLSDDEARQLHEAITLLLPPQEG